MPIHIPLCKPKDFVTHTITSQFILAAMDARTNFIFVKRFFLIFQYDKTIGNEKNVGVPDKFLSIDTHLYFPEIKVANLGQYMRHVAHLDLAGILRYLYPEL